MGQLDPLPLVTLMGPSSNESLRHDPCLNGALDKNDP